ncbi:putative membrane protein YeiB [Kitasatospora gansuensis]|uniref:Putative membrane protein YeiB n=1 Tax=Kitasatospora gansuensis TaxID=258050 RepID=A0A7W7SIE4_9ACTN|nr:DUF418 domain-containing protein [Kitasatospora gansuensis]MBB4951036.1 putative membrane protein YeiB [Kitasatospora gansuensis]
MTRPLPSPDHATRARPSPAPVSPTARLVGLDLARALAVFGMFAAHVGPDPAVGGPGGALLFLTHGRASALFALLAGVALVIVAGRPQARTGPARRQAVARIVIRAVILLLLGFGLTLSGTPVAVILAYYAVYFLLALPLLRLPADTLALIAALWALTGPQLSFVVRTAFGLGDEPPTGLVESPVELLLTGVYPAATWMPFVIAGMAVGRLDLGSAAVRRRLAGLGLALAANGYGLSWLLLRATSGPDTPAETGTVPIANPAGLLIASPHSGTTFEILGGTGVALLVVAGCLALLDALPAVRRLLAPVIAVGTMSLTVYVGHVIGIGLLGIDELPGSPPAVLALFVTVSVLFAGVWSPLFGRGPLEHLLHVSTRLARPRA